VTGLVKFLVKDLAHIPMSTYQYECQCLWCENNSSLSGKAGSRQGYCYGSTLAHVDSIYMGQTSAYASRKSWLLAAFGSCVVSVVPFWVERDSYCE
jgi:hypothetical protein